MSLTYDDITSKTNRFIVPRLVDNVYKASPVFTRLRTQNAERFEGGISINHPIMYAELRGGAFTRGGTFDISYVQTDTALQVLPKYYYVNATLYGTDNVLNRGPEAAMSYVESKLVNAAGKMAKLLATDMYLDGQGTNSTSIQLDGFQAAIDDGRLLITQQLNAVEKSDYMLENPSIWEYNWSCNNLSSAGNQQERRCERTASTELVRYAEKKFTGDLPNSEQDRQFAALVNVTRCGGSRLDRLASVLDQRCGIGKAGKSQEFARPAGSSSLSQGTTRPKGENSVVESVTVSLDQAKITTTGRVAYQASGTRPRRPKRMLNGGSKFSAVTTLPAFSVCVTKAMESSTRTISKGSLTFLNSDMTLTMEQRCALSATSRRASLRSASRALFAVESSETLCQTRESQWIS